MRLPLIARFFPHKAVHRRRRRSQLIDALRKEDARIQAERKARIAAHANRHTKSPKKTAHLKPAHAVHTRTTPSNSARTAPAQPRSVRPVQPAAISTPLLVPQPVPVPIEVPPPVLQQNQSIAAALRSRGTYANDFSSRRVQQQYARTPA